MNIPPLIATCRRIVAEHQFKYVSEIIGVEVAETNGDAVIVDASTANMLVTLYDTLNDDNKSKFNGCIEKFGVIGFVQMAWECMK